MKSKYFLIAIFTSFSVILFSFSAAAQTSPPIPDPENLVAYFQAAVDWGIEVSARYLAYLAAAVLAVSLFKS